MRDRLWEGVPVGKSGAEGFGGFDSPALLFGKRLEHSYLIQED